MQPMLRCGRPAQRQHDNNAVRALIQNEDRRQETRDKETGDKKTSWESSQALV